MGPGVEDGGDCACPHTTVQTARNILRPHRPDPLETRQHATPRRLSSGSTRIPNSLPVSDRIALLNVINLTRVFRAGTNGGLPHRKWDITRWCDGRRLLLTFDLDSICHLHSRGSGPTRGCRKRWDMLLQKTPLNRIGENPIVLSMFGCCGAGPRTDSKMCWTD